MKLYRCTKAGISEVVKHVMSAGRLMFRVRPHFSKVFQAMPTGRESTASTRQPHADSWADAASAGTSTVSHCTGCSLMLWWS